jgi:hypothetical protein
MQRNLLKNSTFLVLSLLLLCLNLNSCDEKNNSNEILVAHLLNKLDSVYNKPLFSNSKIDLKSGELSYSIYQHNNIKEYVIERKVDSITYKGTYSNGSTSYFINDSLQEHTLASRKFIETKLEGFVYLFSIPFVFDRNGTTASLEPSVSIKGISYHVLKILVYNGEDVDQDEFYLYINPFTNFIDYYAQKYSLQANRKIFKQAINVRNIGGLKISDYNVFSSRRDTIALSDMHKFYSQRKLQKINGIKVDSVTLKKYD